MSRRAAALLLALYFATRLFRLGALPMFLDESWHISWSMWIAEGKEWDSPWLFGKGLSIFVNALCFPWAADSYLLASRCVTVLFGALAPLGVLGAARRLYDRETALCAALAYVVSPFSLVYDRLFLTDPVQSAFGALVLLWSVRVAQDGRARDAVVLASVLVLSVFSKVLGILAFLTPALALVLIAPSVRARLRPFALACGAAGATVAYPVYWFFTNTRTVGAALENSESGPVGRLFDNLPLVSDWLLGYWTIPILLLAAAGFVLAAIERSRPGLLLGAAVIVPLLAFLLISALWFPRYLVFLTPPLMILAAATLVRAVRRLGDVIGPVARTWLAVPTLLLALAPALRFDLLLLTDPARAPFPAVERFQFVDGWPSGYGVRDTVAFLRSRLAANTGGVHVVLHSPARPTTSFAVSVAFRYEGWLVVDDLRLDDAAAPSTLADWAQQMPTYAIVPTPRRVGRPSLERLGHATRLVLETRKPDGSLADQIYEVCPGAGCASR